MKLISSLYNCTSLLLLLFLLFSSLSCSSKSRTIKPNPDGDDYELCTSCKGYGTIESVSSAPPMEGPEITEKEKKLFGKGGDIPGAEWCLYSILDFLKIGKFQNNTLIGNDIEQEKREQEELMEGPQGQVERPNRKKIVKCPRCGGVGWIKKSDGAVADMDQLTDDSDYIESLRNNKKTNNK